MLPSILAKQLEKGIEDYIETTFPMTNEPFRGSIRNMLDGGEESVVSSLKKIRRESQNISSLDKALSNLDTRIESAF